MRPTRLALAVALAAGVLAFSALAGRAQDTSAPPATMEPAPSIPSPQPAPDTPQRHKFVVQQFLAWQQGTVDRTLYTDEVNQELNDEVLQQGTRTLANMGGLQSATFLGISHAKGAEIYVYKITCEHGSVNMDFALTPDGKISLIFFE